MRLSPPEDVHDWDQVTVKEITKTGFTSWGDIFMTAKGKYGGGKWRVKTRLSEALRRGYGKRASAKVRNALRDIENN